MGRCDIDNDGEVTSADVDALVDIILGRTVSDEGDVNQDGNKDILDLMFTVSVLLGRNTDPSETYYELPTARVIDWSYAGIPGGIPTYPVSGTPLSPSGDDDTTQIQNALDACPDNYAIKLNAGTYLIAGTLSMPNKTVLRGAGQGATILKKTGTGTSIIQFNAGVWGAIIGSPDTRAITSGVKDSMTVTLASTTGISVGEMLLLNQLNGGYVDSYGTQGQCTFCGLESGGRSLGQFVEVAGVNGYDVTLTTPLHWTYDTNLTPLAYQIDANDPVVWSGIESLTMTQDTEIAADLVYTQGAQYCWFKDLELTHMYINGIHARELVMSEIAQCYIHDPVGGMGAGAGYGLSMTMYSSSNYVYDNICHTLSGGGLETHGGASGNVLAYNYLNDIWVNEDLTYLGFSPKMNHGAHPKMNLWEGNMGAMAGGDFIWGSSSHDTLFRSCETGWITGATSNCAAVRFAYGNLYMNVVGNVLGTSGQSSVYEVIAGQSKNQSTKYIYVLGFDGIDGAQDTQVASTILRHGNYDYVNDATVWDEAISNHTLPSSLYLTAKPSWWGSEPWPPIGPDLTPKVSNIPAKTRFEAM